MKTATIKLAALCLACGIAFPALAESQRIEGINADVFRTIQYLQTMRSSNVNWDEKQTTLFMRAIMKDQQYDDAERALATALQSDAFEVTIAAIKTATFKPNDLVLKGSLPQASRDLLAKGLTPEGFAAEAARQTAPAPGESQVAFFMRKGDEGMAKLIKYALSSPQNWLEARGALLSELRPTYKKEEWTNGYISFRSALSRRHQQVSKIADEAERNAGALLITEAAALLDYELKGQINELLYLGMDPKAEEKLVEICERLGISRESLRL